MKNYPVLTNWVYYSNVSNKFSDIFLQDDYIHMYIKKLTSCLSTESFLAFCDFECSKFPNSFFTRF